MRYRSDVFEFDGPISEQAKRPACMPFGRIRTRQCCDLRFRIASDTGTSSTALGLGNSRLPTVGIGFVAYRIDGRFANADFLAHLPRSQTLV